MNLNKVIITGRITQDLEQKSLPSGQAVVNFSVATNRAYTNKDGQKQEETEFHNVAAFGRQAEIICQYLTKGSMILIEGRLKTRSWDDPNGFKRYKTEIITEKMQLGPRPMGSAAPNFQTKTASAPSAPTASPMPRQPQIKTAVNEEDIPVIEEDADESSQNDSPSPAALDEANNESGEIDVKNIPF